MKSERANATRVLTEAEVERVFSSDLMSFLVSHPRERSRKNRIARNLITIRS